MTMIFSDQCISEDAINVIEFLVKHHIIEDYKTVRNIILGYDLKKDRWLSLYGQVIGNNGFISEELLNTKNLKNKKNNNKSKIDMDMQSDKQSILNNDEFVKNREMAFYDDALYDNVDIKVDEDGKRILDILFTLSENVIEYKYIVDLILVEWVTSNIRDTVRLVLPNIDMETQRKLHYYQIDIRRSSWKEFKRISRTRGLKLTDAFKQAVIKFLENRLVLLTDVNNIHEINIYDNMSR